ncbi:hypothetical protein [Geoalkalibacter halelectricus]|uniref:hypothetical protein n=1 Tax=Geoalkalibacter halelectricus TaxID=2847045 RepID=UPI003D1E388D
MKRGKPTSNRLSPFRFIRPFMAATPEPNPLTDIEVMVAGAVGENRRIDHLTAGAAFPRFESANEIIEFFGVHSSFALGTFHGTFPLSENEWNTLTHAYGHSLFHQMCQSEGKKNFFSPTISVKFSFYSHNQSVTPPEK